MEVPTAVAPVLCYRDGPASRRGVESVRTVREGDRLRVAVFPPGPYRGDFAPLLMSALLVAFVAAGATVWFSFHPAPLSRYVAAVWPLGLILLYFLAMLAVAYDEAYRHVEFEVDGDTLVRTSYGAFGVRRKTWERGAVRRVAVVTHISGSHPRVVLVMADGRARDVLCPGASGALRAGAEQVARHLRLTLGMGSTVHA